jgi:hypothetical protein
VGSAELFEGGTFITCEGAQRILLLTSHGRLRGNETANTCL